MSEKTKECVFQGGLTETAEVPLPGVSVYTPRFSPAMCLSACVWICTSYRARELSADFPCRYTDQRMQTYVRLEKQRERERVAAGIGTEFASRLETDGR